ncbi:MAG: 16S rRNA (adenine(1518)-N(6)/adenine(1519)-N(6))-dimethyltransferase RsmA [Acidobacteriota bacterium]|nr:16S rRNA (adenine(1518)-N(6)/adenine(1519)-N(6))-dimethyltransferase RsmA [Acidobacteriota bacterium]
MKRSKRKALGQHFLTNKKVLTKIINVISPQKQDLIIEIGAGKGVLTFPLAEKAGKVIAFEKDEAFIPILKSKPFPNLTILHKDIFKAQFSEFAKDKNLKVAGNLPYSISSQILFKVLSEKEHITQCTFLLQKEVAERVCAQPGSKKFAPISILFQIYFETHLCFTVSSKNFRPQPKVESALVTLNKRDLPLFHIENEDLFKKFLKTSFQHRRKKLSNNLKGLNFSLFDIKNAFNYCQINDGLRAEQINISQFVALFNFLYKSSIN